MFPRKGWRSFIVLVWCGHAFGATVTPLVRLEGLAGQDFFNGEAGSISGDVDLLVTPVVKFSDAWSLFPTYHGFYQGNQQIQSLAGGGTLFRDSTGQSLLLKSVHTLGRWKLKPSLGAQAEWLRETREEDWGQGLFDNRLFSGGVETEYALSAEVGGRLAYDYYQLAFPRYRSLESAADPTLSRELAGRNVLNSQNQMVTLEAWTPLPAEGRLDVSFVGTVRRYKDQPVVDSSDQLTSTQRRDTLLSMEAQTGSPFRGPWGTPWTAGMNLRYTRQDSNQNHFDVKQQVFQESYYDYGQWRWGPEVTVGIDRNRWRLSFGAAWEHRRYDTRSIQDPSGNFLPERLAVKTEWATVGIVHCLSEHLAWRCEGNFARSRSNTDYNAVFQYNYRMANYALGIRYEY